MKQEKDFIDLYALYGFTDIPSDADLKKRYRELIRKYHPDLTTEPKNVAEEMSKKINYAWNIFKDKNKKAEYDKIYIYFKNNIKTSANSTVSSADTQKEQQTTYTTKNTTYRYTENTDVSLNTVADFVAGFTKTVIKGAIMLVILYIALLIEILVTIPVFLTLLSPLMMILGTHSYYENTDIVIAVLWLPAWGLVMTIEGMVWTAITRSFLEVVDSTGIISWNYDNSILRSVLGWTLTLHEKIEAHIRSEVAANLENPVHIFFDFIKVSCVPFVGAVYSVVMPALILLAGDKKIDDISVFCVLGTAILLLTVFCIYGVYSNNRDKLLNTKKQGS